MIDILGNKFGSDKMLTLLLNPKGQIASILFSFKFFFFRSKIYSTSTLCNMYTIQHGLCQQQFDKCHQQFELILKTDYWKKTSKMLPQFDNIAMFPF